MKSLNTLLGYYDFVSEPKTIVQPVSNDFTLTIAHESAHKALNDRSIIGIYIKNLLLSLPNLAIPEQEIVDKVVKVLIQESEFIQEGFACYTEYQFFKSRKSLSNNSYDAFIETLPNTETYRTSFLTAILIDKIIKPEDLSDGFNKEMLDLFRQWALLDISRFSLNIPFKHLFDNVDSDNILPEVLNHLKTNNPRDRWSFIIQSLSNNKLLKLSFFEKANSTLMAWQTKLGNDLSENLEYSGISYSDNIEEQLAILFPDLNYQKFTEEFSISPKQTESYLEFTTLKQLNSELIFAPKFPITPLLNFNKENLIALVKQYNGLSNEGCYLKFYINNCVFSRKLDWSAIKKNITIEPHETLVMLHRAFFSESNEGRVWNYEEVSYYFFIKTNEISDVLEQIKNDDINICIDYDMNSEQNNLTIQEFSKFTFPIFIFPEPRGSLHSLIKLTEKPFDQYVKFVLQFVKPNKGFAINSSLNVGLIVPSLKNMNLTFIGFYDDIFLRGLYDLNEKSIPLPFDINFKTGVHLTTVSFSPSDKFRKHTNVFWEKDEEKNIYLCPYNTEVVYGHLLDFGF